MKRFSILSAACMILAVEAWAGDPAAAPMLAPAEAPLTQEAFDERNRPDDAREASPDAILQRFRERFPGEGTPRVAVFWNSELPARVSDWRSNHRAVLGIGGEASGSDKGEPVDVKGKVNITAQAEYRNDEERVEAEETAFALQSGLIDAFLEGGAAVVDQALAQRVTDNALEDGTFSRLSPDQARLQMRALSEHADYVLELTSGPDFGSTGRYRIRVLNLKDASVAATFASTGALPEDERRKNWVATGKGFEKQERPVTLAEVGRELALQVMDRIGRGR